jgi:recombinational DNA repair ATPase RecF
VLLLDDILSELDVARRKMVMREVAAYPQALLTTADLGIVPEAARVQARVLRVDGASLLEETPGLSPPIPI